MPPFKYSLVACLTLLLAACRSVEPEPAQSPTSAQKTYYTKLLVAAPTVDDASRRLAEDTIKKNLPEVEVVPAYTLLPDSDHARQLPRLRKAARRSGAGGFMTLRPVAVPTAAEAAGEPQVTARGYFGHLPGTAPTTVPMPTDGRAVAVEVSLYDTATEKLIWSHITEPDQEGSFKTLTAETSAAIVSALRKRELIPPAR